LAWWLLTARGALGNDEEESLVSELDVEMVAAAVRVVDLECLDRERVRRAGTGVLNSMWAKLSGPAPGRVVSAPKSGVAMIPVVLASIPGASVMQ
jgi:uncharacterized Zn finger protein